MKAFILLTTLLLAKTGSAEVIKIVSQNERAQLVELFTSESCSSCPPAEAWLNSLTKSNQLWSKIVPLEFHVNYWNHLSHVDRFSTKTFTQRQYAYNKVLRKGVYTPQVLLNGKDWRRWRSGLRRFKNDKPGNIEAQVDIAKSKVSFTFKTQSKSDALTCNAALMGGDFSTKVLRGENAGKTLTHQFAVVEYQAGIMKKTLDGYICELSLPLEKKSSLEKASLALWVNNSKTLEVLQATGSYL